MKHWAFGGETTLTNVLNVCPVHHRLVHEGGFTVVHEGDDLVFRAPDGRVLEPAPVPPELGPDPVATLLSRAGSRGALEIDDETGLAPWDGRAPDYSACVAAAQSWLA